jgi:hypothetical protein
LPIYVAQFPLAPFNCEKSLRTNEALLGELAAFKIATSFHYEGHGALARFRVSWLGNVQVFANFPREEFNDLAMARNRRCFLRAAINVDGVIAAFPQEFATVLLKVAQ